MQTEIWILGIYIPDRMKESKQVQSVLTKFGCSIKTRLGLHEVTSDTCTNYGLILLELSGDKAEWDKLEAELLKIEGVITKKISFEL